MSIPIEIPIAIPKKMPAMNCRLEEAVKGGALSANFTINMVASKEH